MLQTASAASKIGIQGYFTGKLLQTIIGIIFAIVLSPVLFGESTAILFLVPMLLAVIILILQYKKVVEKCGSVIYNIDKYSSKERFNVIS